MVSGSDVSRACLLACPTDTSGCWLSALPSASLGLVVPVCPLMVYGMSCRRSAVRHSLHSAINSIIALALRRADIPAHLEPKSQGDGRVRYTVSLGTIHSAAQRRAFKFSLRLEFEIFNKIFGAYKSPTIVFRVQCLSSCVFLTCLTLLTFV